jgi:hypothetical protein
MFQMSKPPKEGRGVVKCQASGTDDGAAPTSSRSFPPRGSEISSADQHREGAIVTSRRTSLSPLCH